MVESLEGMLLHLLAVLLCSYILLCFLSFCRQSLVVQETVSVNGVCVNEVPLVCECLSKACPPRTVGSYKDWPVLFLLFVHLLGAVDDFQIVFHVFSFEFLQLAILLLVNASVGLFSVPQILLCCLCSLGILGIHL